MSKVFENREKKEAYIDRVVSDLPLWQKSSGINILFCLTAFVGIIEFVLNLFDSKNAILFYNDSASIVLVLLITFTTVFIGLISKILYSSKIIKDVIICNFFFIILVINIVGLINNIFEKYMSSDIWIIVWIGLIINSAYLIFSSYEKVSSLKIKIKWILFATVILYLLFVMSYMSMLGKWSFTIINFKVSFALYLATCVLYILFLNVINMLKIIKLKQLKHQYIRKDIKFTEVIKYIDLQIYSKPNDKKSKK